MEIPEAVTNLFIGTCVRCGLVVHMAEGAAEDYETGPVRHLGRCPRALPERVPVPRPPRTAVDSNPEVDRLARVLNVPVDCARALHARGFQAADLRNLAQFRFRTAADVADLDADTWSRWFPRRWLGWERPAHFTPTEARSLLAAGIDGVRAEQLHAVGFRGVAAVLAAAPPEIPDGATRMVIRTTEENVETRATDDPATARAWLAGHPLRWRADLLRVESGPRPVHVHHDWSLWDDGRLVHGAVWAAASADPSPTGLSRAAAHAVNLCVHAVNSATGLDPRLWRPLLDVVGLSSRTLDQHTASWSDEWEVGRSTSTRTLVVHTLTHADGGETTLWTVNRDDTYVSTDGAGGIDLRYDLFPDGERARAAFGARVRDNPAG